MKIPSIIRIMERMIPNFCHTVRNSQTFKRFAPIESMIVNFGHMTTITAKYDPETGEFYDLPDQSMPTINPELIPPLHRRMIGATFYAAMVRFYENPDNRQRFETWQEERRQKEGSL